MSKLKNFFKKIQTMDEKTTDVNEAHVENPAEPVREHDGKGSAGGIMSVYHVIILDESGSMSCVTQQTISGCNETLQTVHEMQKLNQQAQRHFVSIYAFDTSNSRYIVKDAPIDTVREITSNDYSPFGGTPLFDAMGYTLTELRTKVDGKQTMGYVTVITDGYENASSKYNIDDVKHLIDELKGRGVIFSFIGANIDAAEYAKAMHIENSMQFEQTVEGTKEMWVRERRGRLRSSAKMKMWRTLEEGDMEDFYKSENLGNYYSEASEERVTPEIIKSLNPGEIFVFGSNVLGKHDGGASMYAVNKFGAIYGQSEGLQGQSYAIPTVGISERDLYEAVRRFCEFAAAHPELTFLVTPIGCGNAGLSPYEVAPMFQRAAALPNVKLPRVFWDYCNE